MDVDVNNYEQFLYSPCGYKLFMLRIMQEQDRHETICCFFTEHRSAGLEIRKINRAQKHVTY